VGGLLNGDSDRYEQMNKPLALEMEHLFPKVPCWVNVRRGYLTGDFEGRVSYLGICRRRLWKRVCLPIWETGRGVSIYWEL